MSHHSYQQRSKAQLHYECSSLDLQVLPRFQGARYCVTSTVQGVAFVDTAGMERATYSRSDPPPHTGTSPPNTMVLYNCTSPIWLAKVCEIRKRFQRPSDMRKSVSKAFGNSAPLAGDDGDGRIQNIMFVHL